MIVNNFYSTILSLYVLNSLVYDASGSNYELELVKDINPNGNSKPRRFERLEPTDGSNNQMFFIADDGIHSKEPWISDGTRDGTKLVKDINSGGPSIKRYGVNANGKIYFEADDGITGSELWLSDGTSAGTKMVKDIYPGSSGSGPLFFLEDGTNVYFFARSDDTIEREELWKTDGTDANTVKITNIQGSPSSLYKFGDLLIFTSWDENSRRFLWKVDGETLSQITAKELDSSLHLSPGRSADVLGKLYFSAKTETGVALYCTDGSIVDKIKDDIKLIEVSRSMLDDQRVLFVEGSAQDFSVWVTDGTTQGTELLLDNLDRVYLCPTYNGKTLFIAGNPRTGLKMYSTDGTVDGTKDFYKFDPGYKFRTGSKMGEDGPFFWVMDASEKSSQIWSIEGSDKEPKKVHEFINPYPTFDMQYLNDATIFFAGSDSNTGVELWKISKTKSRSTGTSTSTPFFIGMGTLFSATMLFSLIFI